MSVSGIQGRERSRRGPQSRPVSRARSIVGWENGGPEPRHHFSAMISFLSKLRESEAGWSLIDQAAVSGGNFLTTLVLARILSPVGYGTFSLLFLSLYAINTCHSSLVIYPLTLNVASGKEDDFKHLNGIAFLHTLALSLPFAAV